MYSFWIPQIWRNARRGSTDAMDKTFILGTSIGRLALPLCEIEELVRRVKLTDQTFSATKRTSFLRPPQNGCWDWLCGRRYRS
jgi:hypothetical protein